MKPKLQEEVEADIEDYETAKNLYDQFELLYGESISYKKKQFGSYMKSHCF